MPMISAMAAAFSGPAGAQAVTGAVPARMAAAQPAASGEAAAAAVGAGQVAEDRLLAGILLTSKILEATDRISPNRAPRAPRTAIAAIIFPIFPTSLPNLQAGEAHKGQSHQAGGDQRDGEPSQLLG